MNKRLESNFVTHEVFSLEDDLSPNAVGNNDSPSSKVECSSLVIGFFLSQPTIEQAFQLSSLTLSLELYKSIVSSPTSCEANFRTTTTTFISEIKRDSQGFLPVKVIN